ncbi:17609_t:CDS:2, partial [Cetraspora pellucida]
MKIVRRKEVELVSVISMNFVPAFGKDWLLYSIRSGTQTYQYKEGKKDVNCTSPPLYEEVTTMLNRQVSFNRQRSREQSSVNNANGVNDANSINNANDVNNANGVNNTNANGVSYASS